MERSQPKPTKQTSRYRGWAIAFMVCSAFTAIFTVADLFDGLDASTRPWDASSNVVTADPGSLKSVQPKPEEWPLAVAQSCDHPQEDGSNRYTVEVKPVRGTLLLRLDVIGRSPERTIAFGRWLTDAFARDLLNALDKRGIPARKSDDGSLISEAPEPAVPLRLHIGTLVLSLIMPLLLSASGILLFRVCKENIPNA